MSRILAWQVPGGEREVIDGIYLSTYHTSHTASTEIDILGYKDALNIYDIHNAEVDGTGVRVVYVDRVMNRPLASSSRVQAKLIPMRLCMAT